MTIANFDYEVLPQDARSSLPDTCLDGNVRSLAFCFSSPKQIRKECEELLSFFESRGGYILSSGCEVPLEADPDCIRAMVGAATGR